MARPVCVCVWLLLGIAAILTHQRASVWTDEYTLWTDAAAKAPLKPRPFINLALALELRGDVDGALMAHQTALALSYQPRLTKYQQQFSEIASQTNIARLLAMTGREAQAERMLDDVIARHPLFPFSRFNRGILLARTGRCAQGLSDLQMAEALDPSLRNPGCAPASH